MAEDNKDQKSSAASGISKLTQERKKLIDKYGSLEEANRAFSESGASGVIDAFGNVISYDTLKGYGKSHSVENINTGVKGKVKGVTISDDVINAAKAGGDLYRIGDMFTNSATGVYRDKVSGKVSIFAPSYVYENSDAMKTLYENNKGVLAAYAANPNGKYTGTDGNEHKLSDAISSLNDQFAQIADGYEYYINQRSSLLDKYGLKDSTDDEIGRSLIYANDKMKESSAVPVMSRSSLELGTAGKFGEKVLAAESYDPEANYISYADFKKIMGELSQEDRIMAMRGLAAYLDTANKNAYSRPQTDEDGNPVYWSDEYYNSKDGDAYTDDSVSNRNDLVGAISLYKSLSTNNGNISGLDTVRAAVDGTVYSWLKTWSDSTIDRAEDLFSNSVAMLLYVTGGMFGVSRDQVDGAKNIYGESVAREGIGIGTAADNTIDQIFYGVSDVNKYNFQFDSTGMESNTIIGSSGLFTGLSTASLSPDAFNYGYMAGATLANITQTMILQKAVYDPLGGWFGGLVGGATAGGKAAETIVKGSGIFTKILVGSVGLGISLPNIVKNFKDGNILGGVASTYFTAAMTMNAMFSPDASVNQLFALAANVTLQSTAETIISDEGLNSFYNQQYDKLLGDFGMNMLYNYIGEQSAIGSDTRKSIAMGQVGAYEDEGVRAVLRITNKLAQKKYEAQAKIAELVNSTLKTKDIKAASEIEQTKAVAAAARGVSEATDADSMAEAMLKKIKAELTYDSMRASGEPDYIKMITDESVRPEFEKFSQTYRETARYLIEKGVDTDALAKQGYTYGKDAANYISYKAQSDMWLRKADGDVTNKNYTDAVASMNAAKASLSEQYGEEIIGLLDRVLDDARAVNYKIQLYADREGVSDSGRADAIATKNWGENGELYIPLARIIESKGQTSLSKLMALREAQESGNFTKITTELEMKEQGGEIDTTHDFVDPLMTLNANWRTIGMAIATKNRAQLLHELGMGGMAFKATEAEYNTARKITKQSLQETQRIVEDSVKNITSTTLKKDRGNTSIEGTDIVERAQAVWSSVMNARDALNDEAKDMEPLLKRGREVTVNKTTKNGFLLGMDFQTASQVGLVDKFGLIDFSKTFRTKAEFLEFYSTLSAEQIQIFKDAMVSNGIIDPIEAKRAVAAKYIPKDAKNLTLDEVVTAEGFKPTNTDFGKAKIAQARKSGEVTAYTVGSGKVDDGKYIKVYTSLSQARKDANLPSNSVISRFRKTVADKAKSVQDAPRYDSYDGRYVIEFEKAAEKYNKTIDGQISPLELEMKVLNKELEIAKNPKPEAPVADDGAPQKGKVWDFSKKITADNAKYVASDGEKLIKREIHAIKKRYNDQIEKLKQTKRELASKESRLSGDELAASRNKLADANAEIGKLEKKAAKEIDEFKSMVASLKKELPKAQGRRDKAYQEAVKRYEKAKAKSGDGMPTKTDRSSEEIQKDIDSTQAKIDELNAKKVQIDGTDLKNAGEQIQQAYYHILVNIPADVQDAVEALFSKTTLNKLRALRGSDAKYDSSFDWVKNLEDDIASGNLVYGEASKKRYGSELRQPKPQSISPSRVKTSDIAWESDAGGYLINDKKVNEVIQAEAKQSVLETQDLDTQKVTIWNAIVKQDPEFITKMFQSDVKDKCADAVKNGTEFDENIKDYLIGQKLGDDYFRYREYIDRKQKISEEKKDLMEKTRGIYSKDESDVEAEFGEGTRIAMEGFKGGIELSVDNIISYIGAKLSKSVAISDEVIKGFEAAGYTKEDAIAYTVLASIAPKGSSIPDYKTALSSKTPNARKLIAEAVKDVIEDSARDAISKLRITEKEITEIGKDPNKKLTPAQKEKKKQIAAEKRKWSNEAQLRDGNLIFSFIMENLQSRYDKYVSSFTKSGHTELVDMDAYRKSIKELNTQIFKEAGRNAKFEDGRNVVLNIDGRKEVWEIDGSMATALATGRGTKMDGDSLTGKLLNASKLSQRGFRAGTTGALAPSSLISQWIKDPLSAFISSGSIAFRNGTMSDFIGPDVTSVMGKTMVDQVAPKVLSNLEETNPDLAKLIRADAESAGVDLNQYVIEAVVYGTYKTFSSSITQENEFFRDIKKAREGFFDTLKGQSPETINAKINKMTDAINNTVLKYLNIENYGAARESYLRSNVYNDIFAAAIKNGRSVQEAQAYAEVYSRNATTNFDRSLMFGNKLAEAVPYLSAAINGSKSFWRLFELDPIGVSSRIGTIYFLYMNLVEESLADEENKKVYDQLREYQKDGNIIWVENGVAFTVPVTEEVSTFLNIARWSAETAMGSNKNTQLQLITNTALSVSPVTLTGFVDLDRNTMANDYDLWANMSYGSAKMFSQISGPVAKTAYMAITGTDPFTGAKIDNSYWAEDEDGKAIKLDNEQGVIANMLAKIVPGLSASAAAHIMKNLIGKSGKEDLESLASILTGNIEGGATRFTKQAISPLTVEVYDRMRGDKLSLISEGYKMKEALMNDPEFKEQVELLGKYRRQGDTEKAGVAYSRIRTKIQELQGHVLDGVKQLQTLYGNDIYDSNFQASIISLMTFDDGTTIAPESAYSVTDADQTSYYAARDLAIQSMADAGFPMLEPSQKDLSILGYGYYSNGEYKYTYANPVSIMAIDMNDASIARITNDKLKARMNSTGLEQARKAMNDKVDSMWDSIDRSKMKSKDWQAFNDKIDDIYAQYDSRVFLDVIFPTFAELEAAGEDVDKFISYHIDDFDYLVKVPYSYMGKGKYDSKVSKQTAYVKSYISDMYNAYRNKLKGGK